MPRDPLRLDFKPGVVKRESPLATQWRYDDMLNVRFWKGRAQKWGGWKTLPLSALFLGIVRGCWAWGDQSARQLLAAGSTRKLYAIADNDWALTDITPIVATITQDNPIATTAGSKEVIIQAANHGLVVDQFVILPATIAAVGGLNMAGEWAVTRIVDANHFAVQTQVAAGATATGGGLAIAIQVELAPGPVDPAQGFGWGAATWNAGTWGTPRDVSTITFLPRIWSLKNFGRVLLAATEGPIYSWDPTQAPVVRAARVANGPSVCTGLVVTSDGIVIAYGTNQSGARDLMEVWYSAQGDYTNWDILALAGDNGSPSRVNRLREGTAIVYAEDLGVHVTLMWTNTALYALQYTGSQYVFNTQLVARQCGLIGPMAAIVVGSTAYWMGPDNLHLYDGAVHAIENAEEVSEWIFDQIIMPTKTLAWFNKQYNEVYWGFCTGRNGSTEPDTYVSYSITGKFWTNGQIVRTGATAFRGSDARPILFGADGKVYRHDDGLSADGAPMPWFLSANGIDLMQGETLMEIDGYVADMERQVSPITVDFAFYDHTPDGAVLEEESQIVVERAKGLTDARGAGRELAITFSGGADDPNDDFRFGIPKLNTTPGASRE